VGLQFREVFLTPDYLGIAMEYAAGGDMFQYVTNKQGLSEDEARWFFQQLILGLDYCRKMVCEPGDTCQRSSTTTCRTLPSVSPFWVTQRSLPAARRAS
jgi:serine/threonine protein kinase